MISGIRVYYFPESPVYYLSNLNVKDNFGFDFYKKKLATNIMCYM